MGLDKRELCSILATVTAGNKIAQAIVSELHRQLIEEEEEDYKATRETLKQGDLDEVDIVFEGEKNTASQWASLFGLTPKQVVHRVNILKWPVNRACTTPPQGRGGNQKRTN